MIGIFIVGLLFPVSLYAIAPAVVPVAASTGPLAPFVIGGVAAFFAIKALWSNPNGELKVQLTTVYNDAADALEENMDRYFSEPASLMSQKERLTYFDHIWNELKVLSQKTAQGLISWQERQRNGRWPWEEYWRDPIANDPRLTANGVVIGPVTPIIVPAPSIPSLPQPSVPIDIGKSDNQAPLGLALLLLLLLILWATQQ